MRIKSDGLKTKLCGLTLDGGHCLFGVQSLYNNGKIVDRIRTANYGYNVNMDIALVYLPLDLSKPGTELEVEVMGESVKATVVSMPLVDPKGVRIRA